ncbi:Uu.00g113170.m01.CDS01 [Anthostomella pinea]|uniref:Uu.00g113170.m01.CDS01 n=1 Tax=Anthostomella pinea TaxID=933095 RepID=A0AAI8VFB6_9PEZI|nr:Uu.00g113170.m01.CDS01 [Anthostomella pinea]
MKYDHVTLPALQMAAAAFLASTCQAKTYCTDQNSRVVAKSNCDGTQPRDDFFLTQHTARAAVGDIVEGRKVDSTNPIARKVARVPAMPGKEAGGFGRREDTNGNGIDDSDEDKDGDGVTVAEGDMNDSDPDIGAPASTSAGFGGYYGGGYSGGS